MAGRAAEPSAPAARRVHAVTRAIRATLVGDSAVVGELFAPDVHAALPAPASSAPALAVEIEDRDGAFADVHLRILRARIVDDEVWVEWVASVVHVGSFAVDDLVFLPSGRRVELHGITVADFAGSLIAGFRQCSDSSPLLARDRARRDSTR